MTPKGDALDHSKSFISDIESNLESEKRRRRELIEKELEDRLRREREESERKLAQVEEEFGKEHSTLKEYKNEVTAYESTRESLENQIRDHLDIVERHQTEIARLTSLSREDLGRVHELSTQLADLRNSTEVRVAAFEKRMQDRFMANLRSPGEPAEPAAAAPNSFVPGPVPAVPSVGNGEVVVNLERELGKLKRIKEMLENDAVGGPGPGASMSANTVAEPEMPLPEPSAPPEPEMPAWSGSHEAMAAPARTEVKMPEINQFIQDFVKSEQDLSESAPPARAEDKLTAHEDIDFQSVFEMLEKYRRSEPTEFNSEIGFFQNRDRIILDGEALLRAIFRVVEEARRQYQRLSQAATPKDQFFIKQELINNQENLRKIVLRSVRMCERENSCLPRYTGDILSVNGLKDMLERLNMDNWSNQDDFAAFETSAVRIKDDFFRRITPPAQYLRSIIQELEG
jgi:hypothetical protein